MHATVKREVGAGGQVTLSDGRCTFVYESVTIAQHLSNTGKLMQIYSDRELYEGRRQARG